MPARSTAAVDITTPYGVARVNSSGRVLWAEWEVWRHADEMVRDGLWSSTVSLARGRQRLVYSLVGDVANAVGAGSSVKP